MWGRHAARQHAAQGQRRRRRRWRPLQLLGLKHSRTWTRSLVRATKHSLTGGAQWMGAAGARGVTYARGGREKTKWHYNDQRMTTAGQGHLPACLRVATSKPETRVTCRRFPRPTPSSCYILRILRFPLHPSHPYISRHPRALPCKKWRGTGASGLGPAAPGCSCCSPCSFVRTFKLCARQMKNQRPSIPDTTHCLNAHNP